MNQKRRSSETSDMLCMEEGDEDDEDQDSEYSGEVTSWQSREDSIEILSSHDNSLDILSSSEFNQIQDHYQQASLQIEPESHQELIRPDVRRWMNDKICR